MGIPQIDETSTVQVLVYNDFDRFYRVREKHTNMRLKVKLKEQIKERQELLKKIGLNYEGKNGKFIGFD